MKNKKEHIFSIFIIVLAVIAMFSMIRVNTLMNSYKSEIIKLNDSLRMQRVDTIYKDTLIIKRNYYKM